MNQTLVYTISLKTSPNEIVLNLISLNFCHALVTQFSHRIACLFLHGDAALLGSNLQLVLEDEVNIYQKWRDFIMKFNVPTFICINSALRRGVYDIEYANLYHQPMTLHQEFKLTGLSTFYENLGCSDRFLQL